MQTSRPALSLFIAMLYLVLTSCTYEHVVKDTKKWAGRLYLADYYVVLRAGSERLPVDAKIYVPFALSILGPKADVPQMEYLCSSLQRKFPQTYCALRPESHEDAIKNAAIRGDTFLISAEVIHWDDKQKLNLSEEDNAVLDNYVYNNAGVDKIEIHMDVYYVRSNVLFDSINMKARSAVLAGFFDKPVEMLHYAYQDLATALSTEKNL